ncbi:MAG: hypothetical protein QGI45_03275, partial [Myxococcota bacterium]|nr:hypothetical protein [Myxococcota bacterium]
LGTVSACIIFRYLLKLPHFPEQGYLEFNAGDAMTVQTTTQKMFIKVIAFFGLVFLVACGMGIEQTSWSLDDGNNDSFAKSVKDGRARGKGDGGDEKRSRSEAEECSEIEFLNCSLNLNGGTDCRRCDLDANAKINVLDLILSYYAGTFEDVDGQDPQNRSAPQRAENAVEVEILNINTAAGTLDVYMKNSQGCSHCSNAQYSNEADCVDSDLGYCDPYSTYDNFQVWCEEFDGIFTPETNSWTFDNGMDEETCLANNGKYASGHVAGFQVKLHGVDISSATVPSEFIVTTSSIEIMGYTLVGAFIPVGEGVLTTVSFSDYEKEICFGETTIADSTGQALETTTGQCAVLGCTAPGACNYDEDAGVDDGSCFFCDDDATCGTSGENPVCTCDAGFDGDGQSCVDINECVADPCSAGQHCHNAPGTYECHNSHGSGGGSAFDPLGMLLTIGLALSALCRRRSMQ